jgi:hypothetical protein
LFILGTDGQNLRAKMRGPYIDDLYLAVHLPAAVQFDRQPERIPGFHEQAALDPHSILADIHHSTGR